ncbi:hypothetical protein CR513_15944, partial [Mucuna pruriens]
NLLKCLAVIALYFPDPQISSNRTAAKHCYYLNLFPFELRCSHVSTSESHDTDTMTVAELQGSIESHVSRILEKTEKENEEALKSQVNFTNIAKSSQSEDSRAREGGNRNSRGRGRGNFKGRGHYNFNQQWRDNNFRPPNQGRGGHNFRSTNYGRGRSNNSQERTNFNCYHCGKFGHIAANCRFKQQANIAENQYQHTNIPAAATTCVEKKELFSSLNETVKSTVKFGNNTNIPILGKGRIAIKLKDGSQDFISDVFYAPGLHHNLLSMGQLSEKGYNMQILNGYCTLIDKNGRFVA